MKIEVPAFTRTDRPGKKAAVTEFVGTVYRDYYGNLRIADGKQDMAIPIRLWEAVLPGDRARLITVECVALMEAQ